MTQTRVRLNGLLVGILIIGLLGQVGGAGVTALFTDDHDGQGSVEAADDFGSAGPIANAGGPYTVNESNSIELDGTNSSGNIKSYNWEIINGSGSLTDATTATPIYNAPADIAGNATVTVNLTVENESGSTDNDTADITVVDTDGDGSQPPTVDNLTIQKIGSQNRKFQVDANVSDPTSDTDTLQRVEIKVVRTDNGNIDYQNNITVSGDNDSISDTTSRLGNKKEYRIEVTVYDTTGNSATETKTKTTG